jgi:hypothetical protein
MEPPFISALRDQCHPCPWRDLAWMETEWPDVIASVRAGGAVVCHTRCGPCDGPSHAGVIARAE